MTIQQINIGAAPNDDTGDAPRTAGQKLNANFTDTDNAASRIVGIAAGQIPTAEELSMIGASANYTSNNLNTNSFGADSSSSIMSINGYASSSTEVVVVLPISMINSPASITVAGTVRILNRTGVVVASAVIPTLISNSTNKAAVLFFSGLSGLVSGQSYSMWATDSTSKITVNQ